MFPLAGMKDLLKNMFQLKNELFPLAENGKKWVPLARMKDFVEIDVSTKRKKLPLSLYYTYDF